MVQRWEPLSELRRMQENIDRLWRGYGSSEAGVANGPEMESWAIPLDVIAKGDDFMVRATLPGVAPEDIQVSIEDNVLTIKAQTSAHFQNGDSSTYLMRERRTGSFHRALRLPDTVDTDKAHPEYQHGVLTITIPKAEAKKARQLKVQVGSGASSPNVIEGGS
jgi:HSP20 family protein